MPKLGLLLLLYVILTANHHLALENFENSHFGFSLSYPRNMLLKSSTHAQVGIILQAQGSIYPTFNILVEPGFYDVKAKDLNKEEDNILRGYELVGLTDAKITQAYKSEIMGSPSINFHIKYRKDDIEMLASVSILSAPDKHYFLTFLDNAKDFAKNGPIRETIVNSFQINTKTPDSPKEIEEKESSQGTNLSFLTLIFLMAVIPCLCFIGLILKHHNGVKY